jgi:hypothetical protein
LLGPVVVEKERGKGEIEMKVVVLSSAMLLAVSSVSADTIIDTIPLWDGNVSSGWDKVAQTLVVPPTDTRLASFEIGLQGTGNYNILVYEWDRSVEHTVGPQLFDSGPLAVPNSFTFVSNVINVHLTVGVEYAVIVDFDSGGGVSFSVGDGYLDGYANFTNDPVDAPWPFNQNSGYDTAFKAVFVPTPGMGALLGLAGLAASRRRR